MHELAVVVVHKLGPRKSVNIFKNGFCVLIQIYYQNGGNEMNAQSINYFIFSKVFQWNLNNSFQFLGNKILHNRVYSLN